MKESRVCECQVKQLDSRETSLVKGERGMWSEKVKEEKEEGERE